MTAKRYHDENFPATGPFMDLYNYVLNKQPTTADDLSPAEKYDLLVGDADRSLTKAMLNEGLYYFKNYGKIEEWFGICHGWAAAAMSIPRPADAITVKATNGAKIQFYPSDIKALASLLWAKSPPAMRFIGGRCNDKDPTTDANGRVIKSDCFDTNPATLHLSLVNQIGIARRGLVFDATYDYEVWNQPIYSYEYSYFNPITFTTVSTLQEAMVEKAKHTDDKFKTYRSADSKYLVGIGLKLVYIGETTPDHKTKDSEADDKKIAVNYVYDLELGSDYTVMGGEWYQLGHPDYLYGFAMDAVAVSYADKYIDWYGGATWDMSGPVPPLWQQAAAAASPYGQPIGRLIRQLIAKASFRT